MNNTIGGSAVHGRYMECPRIFKESTFLADHRKIAWLRFDMVPVWQQPTRAEASNYSGFPEITKKNDEVTIVPCGGANGWIVGDWQWFQAVMETRGCLRSARVEGGENKSQFPPPELPRPWMTKSG
ncbi:hypothetical protein PIB30_035937 [Stylosanthes scabra]|uniref:Uncharacterized protein n=1 Tax=Stylosanthes scabra TaxID=79078 RepID=A0ABU6ZA40_9FABA|nr:hypothetical protein [Stylosanthes scabra]